MLLGDYFQNIQASYKKFFFSGISFDSTKIKKNNIFFAIKGNKVDGNNFISSATVSYTHLTLPTTPYV